MNNARNGSFEIFLPNSFHTTFSYSLAYQGGLPPSFYRAREKIIKTPASSPKKKAKTRCTLNSP